jgi:uncharacterized protein (TIGR03435 family)
MNHRNQKEGRAFLMMEWIALKLNLHRPLCSRANAGVCVGVAMLFAFAAGSAQAQESASQAASQPQSAPVWQTAAGGKMEFEVASIRPGDPSKFTPPNFALNIDDTPIPAGGRFTADFPLPVYIEFAYKLMLTSEERENMLAHLPKWVASQPFVIEAKAPIIDPTKDQMRLMMQSLLADRFMLAVHFETQELPAFALALIKPGKTGPRLRPHAEGLACDAKWTAPPDRAAPSVPPGGFMPVCGSIQAIDGPNHTFLLGARDLTMDHLARYLPTLIPFGRPIVDQTGLTGTFDFTLQFAPEPGGDTANMAESPPDLQGPTAFEALKEQFGLTLKPIKAPIQVLVIDHVEQPSPN